LTDPPRLRPVGDSAVTVELGDAIDEPTNARVRALDRSLAREPFPAFRESVPTYRSLLVCYDPTVQGYDEVCAALARLGARASPAGEPGTSHRVPTLYGGEAGPDLAEVARARGLTEAAVVALHSGRDYRAFMLGFTPGFAYLGLLPRELETPRKATPRVRVPAGSVAIAGRQTAVYPLASPGGWSLLGRTSLRLFDARREPPARILPGDRVRFVPVPELPEPDAPTPHPAADGPAAVEVEEPGLLTTVQDRGRFGWRRVGVTWAGPMDRLAHAAANRVVGNPEDAGALECTVSGPTLRFLRTVHLAVVGADMEPVLHRADVGAWPLPRGERVLARAGNVLAFGARRSGCRATIAIAGGIEVPLVLGSRATDLAAGLGGFRGRALAAGDRLAVGRPGNAPPGEPRAPAEVSGTVTVRVVLGPQEEQFTEDAVARFLCETFDVATTSDRVGCRLAGPRLEHRGAAEIVSDGMVPGSVQVPPDGRPIVMMADSPTTGGYPKLATVATADLHRIAQLVPGEGRVRFQAIPLEKAQALWRAERAP
jgi:antagonist of KipI